MKYILALLMLAVQVQIYADIIVPRTVRPPVLDGKLTPGEWKKLNAPLWFVVSCEQVKNPVSLYMQYDDSHLYVAVVSDFELGKSSQDIFDSQRIELRLGDNEKQTLLCAATDGRKFPGTGWQTCCGKGVIEAAIPLELLSGYRIYLGNLVVCLNQTDCSLFPIRERNYQNIAFHQRFFLGTLQEIASDKKRLDTAIIAQQQAADKLSAQFQTMPKPNIFGTNTDKYRIAANWLPHRFSTGKDFYFMFMPRYDAKTTDFCVPGLKNTLPLFRDAVYQVHTWDLNRGWRDKLHPLRKLLDDPETNSAGYILKKTNAPLMYCTEGSYTTFENELQDTPETRREFISKYGKRLLALDENESVGPAGGFPMIMRLAGHQPQTKKEAYEALKKTAFDSRRTFIRDWAVFYPELAPWRSPISCTFTEHIYLSFGFCMTGSECGPKTLCMPFNYGVTRGAARQYGKPFRTFLTTHDDQIVFPGWHGAYRHYTMNDYRWALRPETRKHYNSSYSTERVVFRVEGPQYGVPHQDWLRCIIYAYMTGTNIFFDESGHSIMYARYNWKTIDGEDPLAVNLREFKWHLSEMGSQMSDFYDKIVCKEDRGGVYAPVALMWDLYHGYFPNYHSTPWGLFTSSEGDQMMYAVQNSLFPESKRIYYSRGFRTSPFGDCFDVITNDAKSAVLASYPVIFFCGEVPVDAELAEKLTMYVKNGGTLVVNWKQIENFTSLFPKDFFGATVSAERRSARSSYSCLSEKTLHERIDFKYNTAKALPGTETVIFTADSCRDPLVMARTFGNGKVLLTMPDFLKERYSNTMMLNIFNDLMMEICRGALPVKIEGDVQFQVHRNKNGWLVSLYNNYGLGYERTWDNPVHKTDPRCDVMVKITPKFACKSVREWFTGAKTLNVKVPAGGVRIVELAE